MVVPIVTGTVAPAAAATDASRVADPAASFTVTVRVHLSVAVAVTTTVVVSVVGNWGANATSSLKVLLTPASNATEVELGLLATNPALWWPNGEGAQALYTITTSVATPPPPVPVGSPSATAVVDSATTPIGFRTFELVGSVGGGTKMHNGVAPLWFKVNGRPIYAKGHNWMPGNVLIADDAASQANKRARMRDAVRVHANTIRIWGGGIYETAAFYEAVRVCKLVSGWPVEINLLNLLFSPRICSRTLMGCPVRVLSGRQLATFQLC